MATQLNDYPLTKFYFSVDWGEGDMSFQEVSGLEGTRDKAEYRGGLDTGFVKRQIPGMKTFGELTLKRGTIPFHNEFFEWWRGTEQGLEPERKDVRISLLNALGDPVVTWEVSRAFPTKFTSTDLNAQNNEVAIETLVLAHEGIFVQNVPLE